MITALRHRLTSSEYTLRIEAIKDGYKSAISSGFEATDPVVQIPNPRTGLPMTQEEMQTSADNYTDNRLAEFQKTGNASRGF